MALETSGLAFTKHSQLAPTEDLMSCVDERGEWLVRIPLINIGADLARNETSLCRRHRRNRDDTSRETALVSPMALVAITISQILVHGLQCRPPIYQCSSWKC